MSFSSRVDPRRLTNEKAPRGAGPFRECKTLKAVTAAADKRSDRSVLLRCIATQPLGPINKDGKSSCGRLSWRVGLSRTRGDADDYDSSGLTRDDAGFDAKLVGAGVPTVAR